MHKCRGKKKRSQARRAFKTVTFDAYRDSYLYISRPEKGPSIEELLERWGLKKWPRES